MFLDAFLKEDRLSMKRLGSLYISGRPHMEADQTKDLRWLGCCFLQSAPALQQQRPLSDMGVAE